MVNDMENTESTENEESTENPVFAQLWEDNL